MSHFDALCEVLENMDPDTFSQIINEKSAQILADLSMITEDGMGAVAIYMDFLLCAVSADGKLTEEEFYLVKPILDLINDADLTYEQGLEVFKEAGLDKPKEYKETMDRVVDLLGTISPELKDDIILVCMMVCSVDGKISRKERKWIQKLIE